MPALPVEPAMLDEGHLTMHVISARLTSQRYTTARFSSPCSAGHVRPTGRHAFEGRVSHRGITESSPLIERLMVRSPRTHRDGRIARGFAADQRAVPAHT
jgi:hypothetical protein